MRTRTIWCITLLLLCHHALRAAGVTNQLPLAGEQAAQTAGTPQQKPSPVSQEPNPSGVTPLSPAPDPMFFPPGTASGPARVAQPGVSGEDEPQPLQPAVPQATEVVDTGVAIPIEAPPSGTPVHIEATRQTKTGTVYKLDGNVLIVYKTYRIQAEHAIYDTDTATVNAAGHLTIDGGPSDEHLEADHGTMNLDQHTGHFYTVTGTLGVRTVTHDRFVFTAPNPFALTGTELIELGPGKYQVIDGSMTSCRLPDPDWKLLASNILIDGNKAQTRNATFTLFHVPLFFLPYASHPVKEEQRQSGLLLPIFGNDTQKGIIVGSSAYIVLGRSADATVGTEYFSKRGYAPFGQVRYRGFGQDFVSGRFNALLDRLPGELNQGGADVVVDGRRDLDSHTRAVADIEYLSSYVYRQAFEENYSAAINSEVKSSASITHEHDAFAFSPRFERYQNFRSDNQGDEIRVLHTPTLQLDALDQHVGRTALLWGGQASADALSRSEPGFQTSRILPRLDVYPHLALPLEGGGWKLRGEAGFRDTFYGKSQTPGLPGNVPAAERGQSLNRAAFTGEVSLRPPAVERDYLGAGVGAGSSAGLRHLLGRGELRHTIEPEFDYRYATGVNHFANTLRFDTTDILSDTNQVEYGLTQRLFVRHLHLHPCKGDEALGPKDSCGGGTTDWLTWKVAQVHFFNRNFGGAVVPHERNVLASTLDFTGVAFLSNARSNSPLISRLRLRTTSVTDLEWDLDYDVVKGRVQASNLFASYRWKDTFFSFGDSSLVNITPKVTALPDAPSVNPNSTSAVSKFNQVHLAAVYGSPTKHGLSGGTNLGYDFGLNQLQYLGVQAGYNRDCCGFSVEMRRYSLGIVRDDTQYLFSFTLAGVGSAGSMSAVNRVF